MFSGFTKESSDFFWELVFNNDRAWLHEHKEPFEALLNTPLKELAKETCSIMEQRFPEMRPKVHVSRIWRDSRRLFGRPPLKESMWFDLRSAESTGEAAAFYFEIKPAVWGCGMGLWCPKAEQMEHFRAGIDANPAAFERLATEIEKLEGYTVDGPSYSRKKGGYEGVVDSWYNRRWVSVSHEEDFGGAIISKDLPLILADDFSALMPMYNFLLQHCS